MTLRRLGIGAAVLLVLAACSGGSDEDRVGLTRGARQATTTTDAPLTTTTTEVETTPTTAATREPVAVEAALTSFDSCETLLADVKQQALQVVGPWGLEGHGGYGYGGGAFTADSATAAPAAGRAESSDGAAGSTAAGSAGSGGPAFSETNVQEEGVDEPDLVKTDGMRILSLAENRLHNVVLEHGGPRLAATLTLTDGWPQELVLAGDRVLVLGQGDRAVNSARAGSSEDRAAGSPSPERYEPSATIWAIDIGEGGSMRVAEVLRMEGMYLSARMVDGIVRVVLSSPQQGPALTHPEDDSAEAREAATRRNRELVASSTVEDWLPQYVVEDHRDTRPAVAESGKVCSCRDTMEPSEFSGFGTLSVLTVDPHNPRPDNAVSVMADGEMVYASTTGLYVATNRWEAEGAVGAAGAPTTQIHKFDIADRERAEYRASGEVPGQVLNQWALSEHQDHLRVATTVFEADGDSESLVTVLAEGDEKLTAVGQVGDLGRGERIYAVRYIGDLGYVVTFRQVDPLYVLDLSDPGDPTVRGELKILGYSAYLHPIGEGLLLGVGQDATEEGLAQGTQVSVFDVSDAARPRRLHQLSLGTRGTSSAVEWDHRAFLYWPPAGIAVIPLSGWEEDPDGEHGGRQVLEAVALRAGAAGVGEHGRVTHEGRPTSTQDGHPLIQRSVVVGDTLYTVSTAGLLESDLETLTDQTWIPF